MLQNWPVNFLSVVLIQVSYWWMKTDNLSKTLTLFYNLVKKEKAWFAWFGVGILWTLMWINDYKLFMFFKICENNWYDMVKIMCLTCMFVLVCVCDERCAHTCFLWSFVDVFNLLVLMFILLFIAVIFSKKCLFLSVIKAIMLTFKLMFACRR